MDKELKERWVNALRTGLYEQTKGVLYRPESGQFCAMGVLCDIQGAQWNSDPLAPSWPINAEDEDVDADERATCLMPLRYGLTCDQQGEICELNDSNELTFEQIAEYVDDRY